MRERAEEVARHYQRSGLLDSIDAGLRLAGVAAGMKVLDLGGGTAPTSRCSTSPRSSAGSATPCGSRSRPASSTWCGPSLVWTQHSTMNIPDKPRLYREAHRVLRRGGGGAPPAGPPPVLTPHVILGDGFRPAFENLLRNLDEHRVRVVEAVFQRNG